MIQCYADSDANGKITAFYNDDIWDVANIPTTAIEITEEEWQDAVANQGKYLVINGVFVLAPPPTTEQQLARAKTDKIAELNTACNTDILAGFTSPALGTLYTYDFDYEAQTNLGGLLNAITAGIIPATDANGQLTVIIWKTIEDGPLSHTIAQFKQLYGDGLAHKNGKVQTYWTKKDEVTAATTIEAVNAITW